MLSWSLLLLLPGLPFLKHRGILAVSLVFSPGVSKWCHQQRPGIGRDVQEENTQWLQIKVCKNWCCSCEINSKTTKGSEITHLCVWKQSWQNALISFRCMRCRLIHKSIFHKNSIILLYDNKRQWTHQLKTLVETLLMNTIYLVTQQQCW